MQENDPLAWQILSAQLAQDMAHLLAACWDMMGALDKKSSADIAVARAKMEHWVKDTEEKYGIPRQQKAE